jgi:hypothetical protein
MNERNKSLIGRVSGEFLMGRASIEVNDPDGNLEIARRHLETGSVVALFNHFKGDFFLWARFMKENLASLDNVTALVAMKYLDPNRSPAAKALGIMFPEWEKSHGVRVLPIVQTYDRSNYPNADSINSKSIREALKRLRKQGSVIAIAPEGTRSKDGGLSEAEEGIELILKLSRSLAVPLAAEHTSDSSRKLINSKTRISVGRPFFIEEIEKEQQKHPESKKKDLIMQRIAVLLPEENRGFYR